MHAQISLTVTESKKLIAKAVAKMDSVQRAFAQGIVALHPSSSTIFIVEELLGVMPATEVWLCGVVVPKGTCVALETGGWRNREEKIKRIPSDFARTWVIQNGNLSCGFTLGELTDRMGPHDVYIKGVNAIDQNNNAGVLIGNRVEGGTIGFMMSRAGRKGFTIIYPVGLEKLIPVSINKAAEESRHRSDLNYSMGSPCNLLPCKGVVINELAAIEILSGATTIPISAGGLGGAEGAVTMVIKGDEKQISKAIQYIESIKGASLPRDVKTGDCKDCENELCSLRGGDKPWC